MAEKIFNARFAQKIDTLTAWASSNIVLKAGEIAFATESVDTVVDGVTIKQPIVLAKIGDGSKTFANLPYSFYAKASDVHTWAKMSQEDFETYLAGFIGEKVEDTNTTYTFTDNATDGVLTIKSKDLNTEEQVITTVNYVTPDELAALDTRVKAIEDDYVKGTDFETWKTTNTQAIADAKSGAETTAANALSAARTEITAEIDADVKALADGAVKTNTDAIAAETTARTEADTAFNTRVSSLEDQIKGLEGAMHFVGESTTDPEGVDGATVEGVETFASGDVVLYDGKEYVYDGSDWILFGDEGSYLTKTAAADTYLKKADAETIYATKTALGDGTLVVAKATADAAGNVIAETYATKNEVETALNGDEFDPGANPNPNSINGKIDSINYTIASRIETAIGAMQDTLQTHGDIVTHNVSEFATAAQGAKADTAVQPEALKPVATSGKLSDLDATFGEGVTDIIFDAGNASGYTQA